MFPRGRSRRYGGKLLLRSVIGRNTMEREATQQLRRGAMVQMKALNTATAWPSQLRQGRVLWLRSVSSSTSRRWSGSSRQNGLAGL